MNLQDITVVITSFKSEGKILTLLDSISRNVKVIIIENSNDKKLTKRIESEHPNVMCYLSKDNLGYAKGNNLGLSKVKSKYALIINPDSKLERNALDTCLSIYTLKFVGHHAYAYSLKETGEYYNLYRELIRHWETVLPKKIYRVSYEELIADQEYISKQMINFCKLDWEEECLNFHSTKREVHTASAVQVRKPIYKTSVNLSKKYKENLNPLISELNAGEK